MSEMFEKFVDKAQEMYESEGDSYRDKTHSKMNGIRSSQIACVIDMLVKTGVLGKKELKKLGELK